MIRSLPPADQVGKALSRLYGPDDQQEISQRHQQVLVAQERGLERALASSGMGWSSDHRSEAYQYVGWHYVAIRAIAAQVSQADVNAYRDLPENSIFSENWNPNYGLKKAYSLAADRGEPIDRDDPLLDILRRPNPQQSGSMFRFEQVLQLRLTGKCLIWNMRNALGKVVRRYILPTAIVEPRMPTPEYPYGSFYVKPELARLGGIQGWFFAGSYLPALGWHVDAREVQSIVDPHPIFRDDGTSPIAASAQWTEQAKMIDNARTNHMRNGPNTDLHVHINGEMDQSDLDNAQARFNAKYAGHDNAGRVIFTSGTEDGVQVTPLTFHPHDMEYNAGFEQMRDAILAIHHVPPLAAGIEQASGREGLYAPLKQFVFFTVQPILNMLAEEDTESWVWQYGENVYVEYEAKTIDDPEDDRAEAELLMSAQAITKGEMRLRLGYKLFNDERDEELAGQGGQADPMAQLAGLMGGSEQPPQLKQAQNEKQNPFAQALAGDSNPDEGAGSVPFQKSVAKSDGVDECGAGSPGGHWFRSGNTCAGKRRTGQSVDTSWIESHDDLEYASIDEAAAYLKQHGAQQVGEFMGLPLDLYRLEDGTLVHFDRDSEIVEVIPRHKIRDWIYDYDLSVVQDEYDQQFNREFWGSGAGILYHATDSENYESIKQEGLGARAGTRGMSNRSTGAAVFTTANPNEAESGVYGDLVVRIRADKMAKDGVTPFVVEGELRSALAHAVGDEEFVYDYEQGISPDTVIIDGSIPPKYLEFSNEYE